MPSLPARTVPDLMAALMAADLNRPRLTFYGDGSERVELSARTLANWVAKSANLLVDELDVEPGQHVALDLPVHWKSVVLALAALAAGATPSGPVVGTEPDGNANLQVRADLGHPSGEPPALVIALASLARRVENALPPGAVDFAATVTGQDDAFVPSSPAPIPMRGDGGRVLVLDDDPAPLARALAAWQHDGSIVLANAATPASALAAEQLDA